MEAEEGRVAGEVVLMTFQSNSLEPEESGSGLSSSLSSSVEAALNAFCSDARESELEAGSGPPCHHLSFGAAVVDAFNSDEFEPEDEAGSGPSAPRLCSQAAASDAFDSPMLSPCSSYSYDPADFPRACEIEEFMSPSFQWSDSASPSFMSRSWSTTSRVSEFSTPEAGYSWPEGNKPNPKDRPASSMHSSLGRSVIAGIKKAAVVMHTLGIHISNLRPPGNKISILAFEIANTITKGASLMQSVSTGSIQYLKKESIVSEGVQCLVSASDTELLEIIGNDERNEFNVFSSEVVRFGYRCGWSYLRQYFEKLGTKYTSLKVLSEDAETTMRQLINLDRHTSELYHAMQILENLAKEYHCLEHAEVDEDSWPENHRIGKDKAILSRKVRSQKKLIRNLIKKSLWSRNMEEIVLELAVIVVYLHKAIIETFGVSGGSNVSSLQKHSPPRLGVSGLSLHYAKAICQIGDIVNSMASGQSSLPPTTRDALYQGLPVGVKAALRWQIKNFPIKEISATQIKAEMQEILKWIGPMAENTIRAHFTFGWVSEWANKRIASDEKSGPQHNMIKIQTLHHAYKEKTDDYICQLVVWLHQLIEQTKRQQPSRSGSSSPDSWL